MGIVKVKEANESNEYQILSRTSKAPCADKFRRTPDSNTRLDSLSFGELTTRSVCDFTPFVNQLSILRSEFEAFRSHPLIVRGFLPDDFATNLILYVAPAVKQVIAQLCLNNAISLTISRWHTWSVKAGRLTERSLFGALANLANQSALSREWIRILQSYENVSRGKLDGWMEPHTKSSLHIADHLSPNVP